jgi:hypothetical protein
MTSSITGVAMIIPTVLNRPIPRVTRAFLLFGLPRYVTKGRFYKMFAMMLAIPHAIVRAIQHVTPPVTALVMELA